MLDIQEITKLYNEYERINMLAISEQRIADEKLVKYVAPGKYGSFINYFNLSENELPQAIDKQIAYFSKLGKTFEWKVYGTDKPENIGTLLKQKGFSEEERESFLVFDVEKHAEKFADYPIRCVKVNTIQGIKDAVSIQPKVWGGDFSHQEAALTEQLKKAPESLSVYVVYVDGIAVSSARITFNGDSPFAGLWGGSTLKEHRNKGYYTDLLAARVLEAKERGIRYLTIDASDMSRPIVEKQGFEYITHTIPYEYEPE